MGAMAKIFFGNWLVQIVLFFLALGLLFRISDVVFGWLDVGLEKISPRGHKREPMVSVKMGR